LTAAVAAAHLAAVTDDTASAMRQLAALTPRAAYADLMWQPWEAYAGERMLLARLHEARGEDADAIRVATLIDAPVPMVHLVFLRQSLELRERVARRLGDVGAAERYRVRLAAWSADRARFP
jgi:NTP pyrophosphatase (non-canonical NTP hydrolase)